MDVSVWDAKPFDEHSYSFVGISLAQFVRYYSRHVSKVMIKFRIGVPEMVDLLTRDDETVTFANRLDSEKRDTGVVFINDFARNLTLDDLSEN